MSTTETYDPNRHSVSFAGARIYRGYADGEFIKVEKQGDDWSTVEGTDGSITRCKLASDYTEVTIMLMQTSPDNAVLDALRKFDRNSNNGAGAGAFFLRNEDGLMAMAMSTAWIKGPPKDVSLGRESTARSWVICGLMDSRTDAA